MRREGRQHGLVRTYRILPPPLNPRLVNSLTSPLTAGLFTKLPLKPTKAHRKVWSGQVHWVRSNDIASSSYKLLTSRVMTRSGPGSNLPGFSETGIVSHNGEERGGGAEVETMKTDNNEDNSEKEDDGVSHYDDETESMCFYDVGMMMMMDHVLEDDDEEDGWCLV